MKPTLTRRDLFNSILGKINIQQETPDPLFAKYSRKIFRGRTYQRSLTGLESNRNGEDLNRVRPVTSDLAPYTGPWTKSEALHLLKRTGFGHKKADLDTLTAMTFSNAVSAVLNVSVTPPAPPVNFYQNFSPDQNSLPYGQTWVDNFFVSGDFSMGGKSNTDRIDSLTYWLFGQACNQDITIREKMMWFWFHFIPIDSERIRNADADYATTNSARISYSYYKMFRDGATGNFKTLIKNVALHPAMMFYLNNNLNTKDSPDENFAREIMELFTLGKGPDSLYNQDDVVAAAKLLTGWRVQNLNTINPVTNFVASAHDTSNKTFSSFFNNTVINGTGTGSGAGELDSFINMIFDKSTVVSKYIIRRLYRFFVYYDIDSTTETNIITPLAQTFVSNNWDILPVLNQLFRSQHFYDMANRGVYIKSPFDLVIGSLRTFNLNYNVSDPSNHEAQYNLWKKINDNVLVNLEQSMGKIPNVSGWPAFYQNPSFYEYWINSNTTQKRFEFFGAIFYGYTITNPAPNALTTRIEVDLIAFVKQFGNTICENPNLLVEECVNYLLPINLSVTSRNTIKTQTLLSNQSTDSYWTDAWINYQGSPTNSSYIAIVKSRLNSLLLTITTYAEYQLM